MSRRGAARPSPPFPGGRRRQRGVFALLLAPLLLGLLLCMGVVVDMALVYNRRTEMQHVADAAALAAARALNGTTGGAAARANFYGYGANAVTWTDAALSFSGAPDGPWTDFAAANTAAAAPGVWFVQVDTAQLDADNGTVGTSFMRSIDATAASGSAAAQAVAGRTAIAVAPLAICALNTSMAPTTRTSGALQERVEFGFRRGVGYNLLDLNPNGAAAQNFVINPLVTPPAASAAANFAAAVLAPFMCSGSMPMASVPATVYVNPVSPATFDFADQLNSRFGQNGACDPAVGVADTNVQEYLPTPTATASNWWGSTATLPSGQTAAATSTGVRRTKADLPLPLPATEVVTKGSYGPLWAFSRPLSTLGAPFALADWPTLYPVNSGGAIAAGSATTTPTTRYPNSGTPYANTFSIWITPSNLAEPRLAGRRVLNVALLNCSLPTSPTATVLAVGRFFMTARASASAISGEFAGVATAANTAGPVGLFQ